uniref:ELMO domain-containing protein n=1 Tax=Syphacia muris TaxID=451379 RepID=A0A0N5B020_9BILA
MVIATSDYKDRIKGQRSSTSNRLSAVSESSSIVCVQPSCSFQSIWSRLNGADLSEQKELAEEILEKAEANRSRSLAARCVCLSPRASRCPLISTVLHDERLTIIALTIVKFSHSNPAHWEMLLYIYRSLSGDFVNDVPHIGPHWETVGFQDTDPMTDLRGVGVFGLCQLLFLISNGLSSQKLTQLLELSNDRVQNFPFAIVSLNWTQMVIDRLKRGKLNRLANQENSVLSVVNGIYRGCFLTFQTLWRARQCTTSDFCKIAEEIRTLVKRRPKHLLNMAVLGEW